MLFPVAGAHSSAFMCIWGCRRRMYSLLLRRSCFSSSAWQTRLLDLTQKVPDEIFSSDKIASVLESSRAFCKLQDAKRELEKQRQADLSAQENGQSSPDEELVALYDSELQAADDLLLAHGRVLEQDLRI
ncbi:prfA [Symbiodinium sp. CCMP2592]|nr:prfA [Symbiodinium sp. CCMP2592]